MANKTGKGGFRDNPQNRSRTGQRNRAAVETAAQLRALYVAMLQGTWNAPPNKDDMTRLEMIAYMHVQEAMKGDKDARELMFDRLWGKSTQPIEHTGSEGGPIQITVTEITNGAND